MASHRPHPLNSPWVDVPGRNARLQLDYKILAPLFRAIWKKATVLVACSRGLKDRALQFLPSVSIEVISNGVDPDRFYPARNGDKSDGLRLLTVGRSSVTKRVDMLIDAVEIVHKDGLKLNFTIAGGGPLEQKLKDIVSQKKLQNIVEVTGRVDPEDMPQIYQRSDIFVSASMQEGMSNAMLEAMASGLPIIATRCEGVEELIRDNGLVIEQASAEAIAETIRKLADDRPLCQQMSEAARKQAERYTWSRIAKEYLALYESVK